MKSKIIVYFITVIFLIAIIMLSVKNKEENFTEEENEGIENNEEREVPADGFRESMEFEFSMLKDPATGKIPRGIHDEETRFALTQPSKDDGSDFINSYQSLGPVNLGGRTRAVCIDKRNSNIILAGSVSSGIYKTSNGGFNWRFVSPEGAIHNVSAIVQDPRAGQEDTWYYATGELISNSASAPGANYLGNGIFKSIDNGDTWIKLASTNSTLEDLNSPFDYVFNLCIEPAAGDVYAACYKEIMRSQDGGATWNEVLGQFNNLGIGTDRGFTDVACTQNGFLYAALSGTNDLGYHGVWASTTGDSASWLRIGGDGSPAGWRPPGGYGRVVLATAPSNNDILYVLYYNYRVNANCPAAQLSNGDFFKWNRNSASWENRSAFMPSNEVPCLGSNSSLELYQGYCQCLKVKSDDSNFVVIGGSNAYRSSDGFTSTANTRRIGGYFNNSSYLFFPHHHPDVHAFAFDPSDPKIVVCGHDGGLSVSYNVTLDPVVWYGNYFFNFGYVTYQYYHVALSPTMNSKKVLGGAQDNGTTRNSTDTVDQHIMIYSGDGASVGISSGDTIRYLSSQFGNIRRMIVSEDTAVSIKPTGTGNGIFVTLFHLDPDNTEILYYADSRNLYRTTDAPNVGPGGWTQMTGIGATLTGNIMCMATSRGAYDASRKLYIGTLNGRIYRLDNPKFTAAGTVPADITGAAMPVNANVNGIAVDPGDDKKVMAVFSNYGVESIWYTNDATVAAPVWTLVEGNLSLPSIRTCAIGYCNGEPEYYVGTSVGLWSTKVLDGIDTRWYREGPNSIRLAVVSELRYRWTDGALLAGTHGNGMFYTKVCSIPAMFSLFPRNSINPVGTEHCVEALLHDSLGTPLAGRRVEFTVKGVNPTNVTVRSDTNGVIKFCYVGMNPGPDTIIGNAIDIRVDNLIDTVFKTWDAPLPVELTSFSSTINNRNVILNWTTGSEENNSGFEVQRTLSANQQWIKITFVKGSGNTTSQTNYTYEDRNLSTGKYKYRLKQIDFNGNFHYYNLTSEVNIGIPAGFDLSQNYPNPFNPATHINYNLPVDSKVTIKLYDLTGREIVTLVNEFKTAGYYTVDFNASSSGNVLSSGVYFYRIDAAGIGQHYTATKRMVLIK